MIRKLFLLFAVALYFVAAPALAAQSDSENRLKLLLKEREELIKEYKFYNEQNSNFWGKKSKKDLLNIIETLKKIIEKDSEIVSAIRTESLKKQAEVSVGTERLEKQLRGDSHAISERIYELNRQIDNLRNMDKSRLRRITALEEQLTAAKEAKQERDRLLAMVAVIGFLMLVYVLVLRVKLSRARTKPRRSSR